MASIAKSRYDVRRPSELGSTLLEIVIAIAILGIASAALLGGIATGTGASNLHRQQADDDAVLVSAGEAVLDNTLNPFVSCSTTTAPFDYPAHSTYNPDPSRYPNFTWPNTSGTPWSASNVRITSITYWPPSPNPPYLWSSTCAQPQPPATDIYLNA